MIADDGCGSATVPAGAACTVLVRFAPARESVTSHETLTLGDDSAEGAHAVDLTGTSVPAPTVGEKGDTGRHRPGGAGRGHRSDRSAGSDR